MLAPQEAARLVCRDLAAIYAAIENNNFHILLVDDSKPFICMNSLCLV